MEISNSVTLLAALAQTSRLLIFRQLVQAGPAGMTPSQLSKALQMPAATLSFHLKELLQSGLCQRTRQGRSLIYSANYHIMGELIDFLQQNCCSESPCHPLRSPS